EASVNRLLEPLLKAVEWLGLERKTPRQKWINLYQRVRVKPVLTPDKEPLRSLIEMVDLRNTLAHFKHGQHVTSAEVEVPASWALGPDGGEVTLNLPTALQPLGESP